MAVNVYTRAVCSASQP